MQLLHCKQKALLGRLECVEEEDLEAKMFHLHESKSFLRDRCDSGDLGRAQI